LEYKAVHTRWEVPVVLTLGAVEAAVHWDVQMVIVALEVMVVPELSLFRMMIVHPPPPSVSTYKRLVRMACKFTHFFLLAPSAFRFNFMFMICNLGYIPLYLLLNYLKLLNGLMVL